MRNNNELYTDILDSKRRKGLDSAGCNHLLAEVAFVFADGAIPSSDGLVFADEDVFGDFIEKTAIQLVMVACNEEGGVKAYRKSWDTTTTPPLNALMASARLSMVGISRPLVGSSKSNMLGASIASNAKTIRLF